MACLYWLNHAYAEPTPDSGKCLLAVGEKKKREKKLKKNWLLLKYLPYLFLCPYMLYCHDNLLERL